MYHICLVVGPVLCLLLCYTACPVPLQVELIVGDIKESVSRVNDSHFVEADNLTVPTITYEVWRWTGIGLGGKDRRVSLFCRFVNWGAPHFLFYVYVCMWPLMHSVFCILLLSNAATCLLLLLSAA